jgi:parallel beta-helix repeat protein
MLGVNVGSTFAGDEDVKTVSLVGFDGNTLYVGGSGPNNYTKIQDAIDNSSDGDTVFVYDDSSPYYELVNVDKSINLVGEDRNTTVINGNGEIITVSASNVKISGFTVERFGKELSVGILVRYISSGNTISNNIIQEHIYGILLFGSNNMIFGNYIIKNDEGIRLDSSGDNTSINNTIYRNEIAYSEEQSMFIDLSHSNQIYENNFKRSLFMYQHIWWICDIVHFIKYPSQRNVWSHNYWDRPRVGPKLIIGWLWFWWGDEYGIPFLFPFFQIDWNPASEPYDIGM